MKKGLVLTFLLLYFFSQVVYAKSDSYIVPNDILLARDKVVASSQKFRDSIISRYKLLLNKKDLSFQELNELKALELIINE